MNDRYEIVNGEIEQVCTFCGYDILKPSGDKFICDACGEVVG